MKFAVRYYTQTGNTKKLAEAVAAEAGVKLSDREFHCRGRFAVLHAGHPDEKDLKAVKTFARSFAG